MKDYYLDPNDAPWTVEYEEGHAVEIQKHRDFILEQLMQMDEDHEHHLLHK